MDFVINTLSASVAITNGKVTYILSHFRGSVFMDTIRRGRSYVCASYHCCWRWALLVCGNVSHQ